MLTVYHAVYSITIPVLVVEVLYADRREDNWLSPRGLRLVLVLFVTVVVSGFLLFGFSSGYWPSAIHYGGAFVAVVMLVELARRLPACTGVSGGRRLPRPGVLFLTGLVSGGSFFLSFWLVPELVEPWPLGSLLTLGVVDLWGYTLASFDWSDKPHERSMFALWQACCAS